MDFEANSFFFVGTVLTVYATITYFLEINALTRSTSMLVETGNLMIFFNFSCEIFHLRASNKFIFFFLLAIGREFITSIKTILHSIADFRLINACSIGTSKTVTRASDFTAQFFCLIRSTWAICLAITNEFLGYARIVRCASELKSSTCCSCVFDDLNKNKQIFEYSRSMLNTFVRIFDFLSAQNKKWN